jgi:hypothetical protein
MRSRGAQDAVMRIVGTLIAGLTLTACINDTGDGSDDLDEVDCTGLTCDWMTLEGTPVFGPTWHQGDLGVDLSNPGAIEIELRDVLFASSHERQLTLRSTIVRDATASLAFDIDFYAPGSADGATFWDRSPIFLDTRHEDVVELGVVDYHRPVLVPSEGAALALRVSKDGTGLAMLDELTLGP